MKKYIHILEFFNVTKLNNDLLCANWRDITMDHILNAVIKISIDLDKPFKEYIYKTIDEARLERQNTISRQKITDKFKIHFDEEVGLYYYIDFSNLFEYGLTELEIYLINERIRGISKYKSDIPRKTYENLIKTISSKLRN